MAHGWEMQHDDSVVVIGQDVGVNGGVFRATAGLQARFGAERVQDTPLAEATIAGMSVGMATHGLRPVAEVMIMDFISIALDQLVNHAAKVRFMSGVRAGHISTTTGSVALGVFSATVTKRSVVVRFVLGQAANVVMRLDHRRWSFHGDGLNHVRIQSTLNQELDR